MQLGIFNMCERKRDSEREKKRARERERDGRDGSVLSQLQTFGIIMKVTQHRLNCHTGYDNNTYSHNDDESNSNGTF